MATPKKKSSKKAPPVQNQTDLHVRNSLTDLINGTQVSAQITQADTMFKSNRWYLISNMRQLLSECYCEIGLFQTIVDVPVEDGMRGGVEISSKQADQQDIDDLHDHMEECDDISTMAQALKWNRLFGGAGILIMTDQDFKKPFKIEDIKEGDKLEFRAVDMWELFYDKMSVESQMSGLLDPQVEHYNYYGKKVHKSRVLLFKGVTAPSFIRPRLRGWGLSCLEPLVRSINQYLKTTELTFEVLDEFKLDIFKIQGFNNALSSDQGTAFMQRRLALAAQQKNFQNAMAMDKEDDYESKELNFAGIAETMEGIRMQVASDMRMPLTKLFGISAAGFSSGEDDIENYNAMIESTIRARAKFHLIQMVKMRFQQKFGYIPDDLKIGFKPLRMLSAEQEENVKTQKFSRLQSAKQLGEIDSKEFRDGINKDNLLPIQLKPGKRIVKEKDEEEAELSPIGETKKSKTVAKDAPEADT